MICDKCSRKNRKDAKFCDQCGQSLAHLFKNKKSPAASPVPRSQLETLPIDESVTEEQLSRILGGRYELKDMLGRGGMGVVYRAYDQQLGMDIAIKFLLDRFVNDPTAVASLKREAKAAMRLAHPNILRLYNFEDTPEAKFLLMEFVLGDSLAAIGDRKTKGRFGEEEVKKYMADVCEGLSYAHGQGIIHRDIKPSNIMLTENEHIKLADFGIAHFKEATGSQFSIGGGTPIYMSPEQVIDMEVDGRADIYSMGVTMYHMLSGSPPFSGDDVRHSHLHVTPKPMDGISDWMNAVVLKCMRKEPDGRWINAEELRDVLKGKKEIGVTMQGFYQAPWLRGRDDAENAAVKTPSQAPGEEPRAPEVRRLEVHKAPPPNRGSGVYQRIERIEKRSGVTSVASEPEKGRAVFGLLAGLTAGMLLILIGKNSRWPISESMLFQLSWIMYGVLMGLAAGIAKRHAIKGLLSFTLGLAGGATAFFLLKMLNGLGVLQGIEPIYYSVFGAVTLGAFLGISDGLYEKSPGYLARCFGWAVVGSALAVVAVLGARYFLFAYWHPFFNWIFIGGALGFLMNFCVGLAERPMAKAG
jgi:serine/threonine-protein kinase